MTVLNFAQWAVARMCDVIIAVHEYHYNITLSDRWYIAILAHYYSCMHEGGRCLSRGGGGAGFPPSGSSKFVKITS